MSVFIWIHTFLWCSRDMHLFWRHKRCHIISFAPTKPTQSPLWIQIWFCRVGICCAVEGAACWMQNEGLNSFFPPRNVFIGPLVKGSNRYQDVRADVCHDTSRQKRLGMKEPCFFQQGVMNYGDGMYRGNKWKLGPMTWQEKNAI